MKATLRCSQVVYGIAKQHFASLAESQAASIDGFPWTSSENPQDFPWLVADELYVVGGDRDNYNGPELCQNGLPNANYVFDGQFVADADISWFMRPTRYCIVSDSTSKGADPYIHEFEYDGEFDVARLTIHYKTAVRPGAPDLRLVTSVEYDGRQIYSTGSIVENHEMLSTGDLDDMLYDYTICDGWYKNYGDGWKLLTHENASGTVVVPAFVRRIADDAFAGCQDLKRLYIKEGCDNCHSLPGRVRLNCVKVSESHCGDVFGDGPEYEWCGGRWNFVSNGFFSGPEVRAFEYLFKDSHCGQVRWVELRPREFQYICSLAFELPREECDEVGGRWLFARTLESGNLLLRLASAFMEGREVEQDFPMALRCCEHACWCAVGDEIPVAQGDVFHGIEVARVDQLLADDASDFEEISDKREELYERAKRLKETVLTHFQRLEIGMFELRDHIEDTEYFIPDLAFEGREDLRDVLLPDELCDKHVVVGRYSFARCRNLRSITVAGMTEDFYIVRGESSFLGCDSLSDRIQYSMFCSTLTLCLNAPEVCTVCSHVDMIAPSAFQCSPRLRRFSWDKYEGEDLDELVYCSRRILGRSAFEGCRNLSHVCVKGWEIAIGAGAFKGCRGLIEFEFGGQSSQLDMPCLNVSFEEAFAECVSLYRITAIGERGYLVVGDPDDSGIFYMDRDAYLSGRDGGRPQTCAGRWQFRACRMLREIPPIVAMFVPQGMFENCESLENVRCIVAKISVMSNLQVKLRPTPLEEDDFRIEDSAFAHCCNLAWVKFFRMQVVLIGTDEKTAAIHVVELMEEPPRQVEFGRDAFLDCRRLSRVESSFASAARSSHPSAFSGCPDFDGFVEVNDDEIGGGRQHLEDGIDLLGD